MRSAIVVGSGPNGLAAAIRLAQAGLRVEVIEAADEIGGGVRSAELSSPGLIHDHCSAFHPLGVSSPFMRSLPLERYGLRWRWPEIDCAHPFDDGSSALLYRDIDATAAGLNDDGARWKALFGPLATRFDELATEALGPFLHLPRHPVTLARLGLRALAPATSLARTMRSPAARALFTGMAAHAFTRLNTLGSSAAGVMLVAAGHRRGWPVAEGGSSAIATAMAAYLTDLGGSITTGSTVSTLGDLPRADIVMLDLVAQNAVSVMGDVLPNKVARSYRSIPTRGAAYKVDYVIDGEIGWRSPECARAGTVHLGGTMEQIAAAEADVLDGRMPDRPFTLVGQQWVADPTRAVGNRRPLWAYAHVPAGYEGDVTDRVTAQIERFAPGFRDQIVAVHASAPQQMEQYNANYIRGDISCGPSDLRHLLARPRATLRPYRTGVDGIYLCSAATPPGGGVHGMCGFHAAQAALSAL